MSTSTKTVLPEVGAVVNLLVDQDFITALADWESTHGIDGSRLFEEIVFKFKAHGPFVTEVLFLEDSDKGLVCASKRRFDIENSKQGVFNQGRQYCFKTDAEAAVKFAKNQNFGFLPNNLIDF